MGPITLFDKSFLQSLSIDESVWFDHFFLTNVCPIFYVETLADLDKSPRKGRRPDEEVRIIADKFPEMHGMPCAHHIPLCTANLLGRSMPMMTGQIPLSGGRLVNSDGKTGAVFELSPEAEAFSRWQKQEFLEVERLFAKAWRGELLPFDSKTVLKEVRELDIKIESCKSLEQAKQLAESVINRRSRPIERMKMALISLNVPEGLRERIVRKWLLNDNPPLVKYAPYAAYVLTVVLFFKIAIAANLISNERPSNRTDIAYLFYLPFCMMFVSSDRLHERCAPLFMRGNQGFVWGPELKNGLRELNTHYLALPEANRDRGVLTFGDPAEIGDRIVVRLWDEFIPKWRNKEEIEDKPQSGFTYEKIKRMENAPPLSPEVELKSGEAEQVLIKKNIRRKKGSWEQVPRGIKGDQTEC